MGKGDKVYALLREALAKSQRVGIARVVIQTKQHLAALMPDGPALVLILLRWASEIRSIEPRRQTNVEIEVCVQAPVSLKQQVRNV